MGNSYGNASSITAGTPAGSASGDAPGIASGYPRTDGQNEQTYKHSTLVDLSPNASPANRAGFIARVAS